MQKTLRDINMDKARDALFDAKDKFIELRREERNFKKYETKYYRLQQLNNTANEFIQKTIIDIQKCDMNCAVNCVRPKLDFPKIVQCLDSSC
jgi:hypothetical protein